MLTARLTCRESRIPDRPSGRSSVVEHDLAKVGVEGSNPFARSSFSILAIRSKRLSAANHCAFGKPSDKAGQASVIGAVIG